MLTLGLHTHVHPHAHTSVHTLIRTDHTHVQHYTYTHTEYHYKQHIHIPHKYHTIPYISLEITHTLNFIYNYHGSSIIVHMHEVLCNIQYIPTVCNDQIRVISFSIPDT